MTTDKKILIAGIGALGGIFAFRLLKNNFECTLVTNNETLTNVINEKGLNVNNETIKAKSQTYLPENQQFDYIFLMMKTNNIVKACQEIKEKKLLHDNTIILTIQNGNVYDFIKDIFPGQIVTGVIGWNATMNGPGHYEIKTPNRTIIGDMFNQIDLSEIKNILTMVCPGEVVISKNISGHIWSKLAVTSAINSLSAISGMVLGEWTRIPMGRELFLAVYSETYDLAKKQNIRLEKIVSNPSLFYITKNTFFIKRIIKRELVKKVGSRYGKTKTSMLQDIERGRPTEIDYLNGYISKKGKEVGYSTPVNDKLTELVKLIEGKEIEPNPENFNLVEL